MRLSAPFRRQHLISTALELFASQGYEGTTTREIGQRSGVTEAIIFRHFPTKEDLYWAVIEEQCNIRGAVPRLREMLDSDADEVTKFTQIAEDILERNTKDPKLFRLLLFCGLENHELSDRFFQTRISERFEILAEYIRDGIRQGRFRKMDPLIAARGFFGMAVYHFLIQEIFGGRKSRSFDAREVSRTLAGIWLAGMLREQPESANAAASGASVSVSKAKNGANGHSSSSKKHSPGNGATVPLKKEKKEERKVR